MVQVVGEGGAAAPAPGTRRWRLLMAYDGGGFRGFAAQEGVPTVAGALAEALARTARLAEPPLLVCAGRTDAGVHAQGQVVHVDLPDPLPPGRAETPLGGDELRRALNRQLAPAVVVRAAEPARPVFDARRSATGRRYRYLIWNAPVPDPLLAPVAWHVAAPLDLRVMAASADALLGEHDFRHFCRRPPGTGPEQPIVRRVSEARWSVVTGDVPEPVEGGGPPAPGGRLLRFDIAAGSFCHQMVRSLVAKLVEAGQGRGNVASIVQGLRSGSRAGAPSPAPPHGLCLVSVSYP